MDRNQFISELKNRLRRLPESEVENAVAYYQEYFDDAGTDNEEATIKSLGTPAAVASKIIGEFAVEDLKKEKPKSNKNTLWILIAAVLSAPLTFPLLITAVVLIVAFAAVLIALLASAAAVSVAGIAGVVLGGWSFNFGLATGLFQLGAGLLTLGIGLTFLLAMFNLGRFLVRLLQKILGKLLIGRTNK